jgi:tRNA(Ile)-lysidine synthase
VKQLLFSPDKLDRILHDSSPIHDYIVAYSGGMDSHVLLHAIASLAITRKFRIAAFHVNHGLHPDAGLWEDHCVKVCNDLSIEIHVFRLKIEQKSGESMEAIARAARYNTISDNINPGQVVLTAHHMRDQAETLLLHLMRGSGVSGLSGMPILRPLNNGWLLRPLLQFNHDELLEYARLHNLRWISDSSNYDIQYGRNYVRHKVLPVLRNRWPSAETAINRSIIYLSEAAELSDSLAQIDMESTLTTEGLSLDLTKFSVLPVIRRKNLLRYWIKRCINRVPSFSKLEEIVRALVEAKQDSSPSITWDNVELRRYRNQIYLLPSIPPRPAALRYEWDLFAPLELPLGLLKTLGQPSGRAMAALAGHNITVRFRCGGEQIRPVAREHTHTVKNLFQEAGVPPWLRDYCPMIYIDGKLALIPGLCRSRDFPADLFDGIGAVIWELKDYITHDHTFCLKTEIGQQ